jgi:hypothetical protein
MRVAQIAAAAVVGLVAIGVIVFVFVDRDDAPSETSTLAAGATSSVPTPTPTPARPSWLDGLSARHGEASPVLLSCLAGTDDRLTSDDDGVPSGVDIALTPGAACGSDGERAEWYAGVYSGPTHLCNDAGPLRIIAVGGGGTDLLDPTSGESTGFLPMVNGIAEGAAAAGRSVAVTLAASAVFDAAADAQAAMEQWLTGSVRDELAALPCARVVILGHSHGGATVTQVTAALDAEYGDRMLGVLVDRTIALYDRPVDEWPVRTPILNFYQLNEGWHGIPIDRANVTNFDQSAETAPVPSLGGEGPIGIVDHTTLDDSPVVQQGVIDAVLAWVLADASES